MGITVGNTSITFNDGTLQSTASAGFPTGTRMLFQQTAAPTGWTKDVTAAINNGALRTVTGSVVNGGTAEFTTAFTSRTPAGANAASGATTLTTAQMPAHTHSAPLMDDSNSSGVNGFVDGDNSYSTLATSSTGGGGSHTHGAGAFTGTAMDFAVKYRDVIIAVKD
jgi:hypothetical protein